MRFGPAKRAAVTTRGSEGTRVRRRSRPRGATRLGGKGATEGNSTKEKKKRNDLLLGWLTLHARRGHAR
eukprot:scaffold1586_cov158-Amphora_coffeaeformis.AAC.7